MLDYDLFSTFFIHFQSFDHLFLLLKLMCSDGTVGWHDAVPAMYDDAG
jgi:hypothetical protein